MTILQHAATAGPPVYRAPRFVVRRCRAHATSSGLAFSSPEVEPRFFAERLHWGSGGSASSLTVGAVSGTGSAAQPARLVESMRFDAGDLVVLTDAETGREWFRGPVIQDRLTIQAGPDRETLTVTAAGPEQLLRGKALAGQWHPSPSLVQGELAGSADQADRIRAACFGSDLPVVFNPGGRPNAWPVPMDLTSAGLGVGGRAFAPVDYSAGRDADGKPRVAAEHWNACTAARSLLEWADDYATISEQTPWAAVAPALSALPLPEVDVDGLDLLDALAAVLHPRGWSFAVEPWSSVSDRDGVRRWRLCLFPLSGSAVVHRPVLAPRGEAIDSTWGRRAEVQRIEHVRDELHTRNAVRVLGDFQRFAVNLQFADDPAGRDLHPAWDLATYDLGELASAGRVAVRDVATWTPEQIAAFLDSHHVGGSGFADAGDAYRSFAWNEDGSLSHLGLPMPEIAAYLPTRLGERFVCRSRPVGPSFEPGPDGATLRPARVELGIVGCPDAWIPVEAAIWTHACGLTLRRAGFVQAAGGRWEAWKPWASLRGRALLVGEADESERIVRLSYLQALYNALHRTDTLRLAVRLIGSVEADACVLGLAERRISSSCPYSAERVVRRPGRFACRQASPAGGELPDLPAALGDDTAPAGAYAAALRDAGEHGLGRGTITLRNVTRAYAPGSAIDATDGRTVALAAGAESPAPVVVAVTWRLGDGVNKTDLTLETPTGGLRS